MGLTLGSEELRMEIQCINVLINVRFAKGYDSDWLEFGLMFVSKININVVIGRKFGMQMVNACIIKGSMII